MALNKDKKAQIIKEFLLEIVKIQDLLKYK